MAKKRNRSKRRSRVAKATSSFLKNVLIWSSIIGGIGSGYAFIRPDLVVEPGIYLNESEPYSAQFKVTNSGWLPLYDMTFTCHVDSQLVRNSYFANAPPGQTEVPRLSAKQSTTTSCPAISGYYPFVSDTQIIVSARPPFWWHRMTWKTRFVSAPDSRGIFRWLPRALDD